MMAKEIKGSAQTKEALIEFVSTAADTFDIPYPVDIKISEHTGLLDCYAVFWVWMRSITEHLKEKWPMEYSKLDREGQLMHDVVCAMFLGYSKPVKVGKTLVDSRLKTLTNPKMSKGELVDLLRRIEEWCVSIGITLPQPPSEYLNAK